MSEPNPEGDLDGDVDTAGSPLISPASSSDAVTKGASSAANARGFLGSGLRGSVIAAIILTSTIAFFFWGGPLWSSASSASHVGRIGGSYLLAIPLVALALVLGHRWSWSHLLSAMGIVWSVKLVITATAYALIAPGSATQYAPARTWDTSDPSDNADRRRSASSPTVVDTTGDVFGVVAQAGRPISGAAVVVEGLELPVDKAATVVSLAIARSQYAQPVYFVSSRDRVLVKNNDAVLHTLLIRRERHAIANIPIPPSATELTIRAPEPGTYELSCENHDTEHALLIVDQAFATLTDGNGRFELRGVPTGDRALVVVRQGHDSLREHVALAPNDHLTVSIAVP